MTRITTSAPGKVLLCGEYVVLDGAPSMCVAIDRRAHVVIKESTTGGHSVRSPGFADEQFFFSVDESGEFTWLTDDAIRADFSLLEKVWAALKPQRQTSMDIVLDSRALTDAASGRKFGLGGSAALTVALSAAMASLQNETIDVERMIETHRQFQNGLGSGADVATAYAGGLIEYQIGNPAMLYPMKWHSDLKIAVLWSGHSASTSKKLAQFDESDVGSGSRQDLATGSAAILDAWRDSDAAVIMSLFRTYTETLFDFSDAHNLGIFDHGHSELRDAAAECDVVYKPCGAGGGDVGMVLALSEGAIDQFTEIAAASGFVDLQLKIDDDGLTAVTS